MDIQRVVMMGPRAVEIVRETLADTPLAAHEVVLRTRYSLISPGTELLVYRGQAATLPIGKSAMASRIRVPNSRAARPLLHGKMGPDWGSHRPKPESRSTRAARRSDVSKRCANSPTPSFSIFTTRSHDSKVPLEPAK